MREFNDKSGEEERECESPKGQADLSQTILVISSNRNQRCQTVAQLEVLGHRVIQAENGVNALRLFREFVDLIIAEVDLEDMTGPESVALIRHGTSSKFAAMYLCDEELESDDFDLNPNAVLNRPFSQDQFAAKIRSILSDCKP